MFDEEKYIHEMRSMVTKALEALNNKHPEFEIYTASIWTDPSGSVSSINFDTKENSDKKVALANDFSKKYFEKYTTEGNSEEAKLFEPITRNCNPADFLLRDFGQIKNPSIPKDWEDSLEEDCWEVLEPVLITLGEEFYTKISALKTHPDFELSVNGSLDWYEHTWPKK